ncbi:MAG TPA: hypothetical protein DGT21_08265 [Armatimonadetes bacterium]|nr:hypothetical protein [Armatimonadota bacterium]
MPKIVWPQQPTRIREACARHGIPLPDCVEGFLARSAPPQMTSRLAQAFLRCFYAARDLDRTERDLGGGGPQTDTFAAMATGKRVEQLRERLSALAAELARGA